MEGQVHQVTLQVVFVEVAEKRLVRQLDDGLYEVTGGLVLQKDQEWTERKGNTLAVVMLQPRSLQGESNLTPGAAL